MQYETAFPFNLLLQRVDPKGAYTSTIVLHTFETYVTPTSPFLAQGSSNTLEVCTVIVAKHSSSLPSTSSCLFEPTASTSHGAPWSLGACGLWANKGPWKRSHDGSSYKGYEPNARWRKFQRTSRHLPSMLNGSVRAGNVCPMRNGRTCTMPGHRGVPGLQLL